jgi:hypothetical protein
MRLFTATEKATGKSYNYTARRIYGRQQFSVSFGSHARWFDKLTDARKDAQGRGMFRYRDDPPLVYIVD